MSFRKYGVTFAYAEEIDWTSDRQSGGLELNSHPSLELKFKKSKSIYLPASACSDS